MRNQRNFFILTLVVSILLGIILPLALGVKDPVYIAISFTLVWAIYSIILLGYVFLIEGRRNRNRSKTRKEENPFGLHSIQEWEALWELTVKRTKGPGMRNQEWN
jgi:hypothetical protein